MPLSAAGTPTCDGAVRKVQLNPGHGGADREPHNVVHRVDTAQLSAAQDARQILSEIILIPTNRYLCKSSGPNGVQPQ